MKEYNKKRRWSDSKRKRDRQTNRAEEQITPLVCGRGAQCSQRKVSDFWIYPRWTYLHWHKGLLWRHRILTILPQVSLKWDLHPNFISPPRPVLFSITPFHSPLINETNEFMYEVSSNNPVYASFVFFNLLPFSLPPNLIQSL